MELQNTRERILQYGMDSFLKHGFKGAPLRKIVAEAGVSTGAFYGYFANKEELFYALTDETVSQFTALLDGVRQEMRALPPDRRLFEMCGVYIRRIPEIVDFLLANPKEIRLILTGSQGTKYEHFWESLQECNSENIQSSAQAANAQIQPLSKDTVRLLMSGYFSMLAKLILEETDRDKIIRCMTEVAKVFEKGILALMEGKEPPSRVNQL